MLTCEPLSTVCLVVTARNDGPTTRLPARVNSIPIQTAIHPRAIEKHEALFRVEPEAEQRSVVPFEHLLENDDPIGLPRLPSTLEPKRGADGPPGFPTA